MYKDWIPVNFWSNHDHLKSSVADTDSDVKDESGSNPKF